MSDQQANPAPFQGSVCHVCHKHLATTEALIEHTLGAEAHPMCVMCDTTFLHEWQYRGHLGLHHPELRCSVCGFQGENPDLLRLHWQLTGCKERCPYCPLYFERHALDHHLSLMNDCGLSMRLNLPSVVIPDNPFEQAVIDATQVALEQYQATDNVGVQAQQPPAEAANSPVARNSPQPDNDVSMPDYDSGVDAQHDLLSDSERNGELRQAPLPSSPINEVASPDSTGDDSDGDLFDVADVLGKEKRIDNETGELVWHYLIRWGPEDKHGPEDDSWEPVRCIQKLDEIEAMWQRTKANLTRDRETTQHARQQSATSSTARYGLRKKRKTVAYAEVSDEEEE